MSSGACGFVFLSAAVMEEGQPTAPGAQVRGRFRCARAAASCHGRELTAAALPRAGKAQATRRLSALFLSSFFPGCRPIRTRPWGPAPPPASLLKKGCYVPVGRCPTAGRAGQTRGPKTLYLLSLGPFSTEIPAIKQLQGVGIFPGGGGAGEHREGTPRTATSTPRQRPPAAAWRPGTPIPRGR